MPVICLHHFLFTCLPSFMTPLLPCCKKQKREKKMRKSSSECSSSSSVPGQVGSVRTFEHYLPSVRWDQAKWAWWATVGPAPQIFSLTRCSPGNPSLVDVTPLRCLRPTRVRSICLSMPEIHRMSLLCGSGKPFLPL